MFEANSSWNIDKKDAILSHSVYNYFPNMNYVNSVNQQVYNNLKTGGIAMLLDLNDAEFQDAYHKTRSDIFGSEKDYFLRYKEYPHLFFDKNLLKNELEDLGFSDVDLFESGIDNANAKFRFNLIAHRL